MTIRIFFISISLVFFTNFTFGQNSSDKDSVIYKSHLIQDYRIEKLNNSYSSSYHLSGYRVQIYSGNKKQPARELRLKFSRLYRKVKAHESYQQPNFKIRVGDFKTKLEALKFRKELLEHYPNCFIVKDDIEIEELVK